MASVRGLAPPGRRGGSHLTKAPVNASRTMTVVSSSASSAALRSGAAADAFVEMSAGADKHSILAFTANPEDCGSGSPRSSLFEILLEGDEAGDDLGEHSSPCARRGEKELRSEVRLCAGARARGQRTARGHDSWA